MGRQHRIELAGAVYHVYARGNRRAPVFESAKEYEAYLGDLERLAREHGAEVLAFCLMPNHTHLCLRTGDAGSPLSVLMQRLNMRHARRFNWARDTVGRLNASRYKSQLVGDPQYLLTLVRYIHLNPVRANLAASVGDWPHTSHAAYLGRGRRWVATSHVLTRVGGAEGYEHLMRRDVSPEEAQLFRPDVRGRRLRVIAGSTLFHPSRVVSGPFRRKTDPGKAAAEETALLWARTRGLALDRICRESRNTVAIALRVELAKTLREAGHSLRTIGELLGCQEPAVSKLLRRERAESGPDLSAGLGWRLQGAAFGEEGVSAGS